MATLDKETAERYHIVWPRQYDKLFQHQLDSIEATCNIAIKLNHKDIGNRLHSEPETQPQAQGRPILFKSLFSI